MALRAAMRRVAILKLDEGNQVRVIECPQSIKYCSDKAPGDTIPLLIAMYMAHNGIAIVQDSEGKVLSFEEFLKRINKRNIWIVFSVYFDLVKRGRVVVPGLMDNELVLEGYRTKVYIFEENSLVKPEHIIEIVERALRQDYRVVVAIVDMYGDVTYYEVNKMVFHPITRRGRVR